jgi:hypothetical protein
MVDSEFPMNWNNRADRARLVIVVGTLLIATIPVDVMAYVDPGTTGMISQMLYVLFYGALGLFFYFLRQIKQYLSRVKDSLAKLFGRRS